MKKKKLGRLRRTIEISDELVKELYTSSIFSDRRNMDIFSNLLYLNFIERLWSGGSILGDTAEIDYQHWGLFNYEKKKTSVSVSQTNNLEYLLKLFW